MNGFPCHSLRTPINPYTQAWVGHGQIHFMKPFHLAKFTSIKENNTWALPASEADATKSTRTLFPTESPRTLSRVIQLPAHWCLHNHCHPYIFSLESVLHDHFTETQIIKSRRGLRSHLTPTAYFKVRGLRGPA